MFFVPFSARASPGEPPGNQMDPLRGLPPPTYLTPSPPTPLPSFFPFSEFEGAAPVYIPVYTKNAATGAISCEVLPRRLFLVTLSQNAVGIACHRSHNAAAACPNCGLQGKYAAGATRFWSASRATLQTLHPGSCNPPAAPFYAKVGDPRLKYTAESRR